MRLINKKLKNEKITNCAMKSCSDHRTTTTKN